mgnify:CR=1 FL=1
MPRSRVICRRASHRPVIIRAAAKGTSVSKEEKLMRAAIEATADATIIDVAEFIHQAVFQSVYTEPYLPLADSVNGILVHAAIVGYVCDEFVIAVFDDRLHELPG